MSSIFTAEEISAQMTAWKAALMGVSTSQSYRMQDGRTLTRADLPEIRRTLEWLGQRQSELDNAASGGGPLNIVVARPYR